MSRTARLSIAVAITLLIFTGIAAIWLLTQKLEAANVLAAVGAIIAAVTLFLTVTPLAAHREKPQRRLISIDEYLGILRTKCTNANKESPFVPLPMQEYLNANFSEHRRSVAKNDQDARYFNTIDELLVTHPRFVLVGEPGSGKSTVLRKIGIELVDKYLDRDKSNRSYIPFLVDLGKSENPVDPRDLIRYWWDRNKIDVDVDPLIDAGSLFLLLDGLNELPDGNGKQSLKNRSNELKTFLRDYTGHCIITCRIADYNSTLEMPYPEVAIAKLRAKEITEFVSKHLTDQAQSFIDLLRARRERLALATNPYALTMMISLFARRAKFRQQHTFPTTREELYESYIEASYQDNLREKNGNTLVKLRMERLLPAWSNLAYRMMLQGYSNSSSLDFANRTAYPGNRAIGFRVGRNQHIVDGINLGLLQLDQDSLTIRFYHQTLFEYFALPMIKLNEGNLGQRIDLIEKLENLGEVALPTLPVLTKMYLAEIGKLNLDLHDACRAAVLSIALEVGTVKGVYFVLTVMLETAIRLFYALKEQDYKLSLQLSESLVSDFDKALSHALADSVQTTRARNLEQAFLNLVSRYVDETDDLRAALGDEESEYEHAGFAAEKEQHHRLAIFLARANADALTSSRTHIENVNQALKRQTLPRENDINEFILTLAETRAVTIGEPLDFTADESADVLRDVIAKYNALHPEIARMADELGERV